MADWLSILNETKKWEGGYSASPLDTGNYNSLNELVGTNHGISALVYEEWINRPPSIQDMKNMSYLTAKKILYEKFFLVMGLDKVENQSLASLMFFLGMNHGIGANASYIRQILGVTDRWTISLKTINLINKRPRFIFNKYYQLAYKFYSNANPIFRKGWLNRLKSHKYSSNNKSFKYSILGALALFSLYKFLKK